MSSCQQRRWLGDLQLLACCCLLGALFGAHCQHVARVIEGPPSTCTSYSPNANMWSTIACEEVVCASLATLLFFVRLTRTRAGDDRQYEVVHAVFQSVHCTCSYPTSFASVASQHAPHAAFERVTKTNVDELLNDLAPSFVCRPASSIIRTDPPP